MNNNQEELSLRPLKKDILTYSGKAFKHDLWAAFGVALLSIPQALAYSIVVDLPAYCGLVATIFGTAISALLGSSKHLVIGPNNTTVLLVQAATFGILTTYYPLVEGAMRTEIVLQVMAALVLLIGLFQLLAAFLKLGRAIQFVSQAVVVGYVMGAAFALIVDQLYTFLGVQSPDVVGSLFEKVRYLIIHLPALNPTTALVGTASFLILIILKKMKLKIPGSLTMLLVVTVGVQLFGVDKITDISGRTLQLIGHTGDIEGIIPSLQLPLFELRLLNSLVPIAFAIALFSMLETTSIAKSIAAGSGQRLRVNQEFLGLGASNFVLSFFGALPCSGSISRTQLNYESGGMTRFSAVFSAVFVALMVSYFGTYIHYVPLASLAALLVATAMRTVDRKQLKLCLQATHSDAFVLVITFLSCIFFTLQVAFYIGVLLSIALYLRKAAIPQLVEYCYDEETEEFRPISEQEKGLQKKIRIINIEGELFFGAVDFFQQALKAIAEDDLATKVFVLRMKHVRDIDATAAFALKQLYDYLRKSGRHLVVANIPKSVWLVLENSRLIQHIGRENLFSHDERNPHKSLEVAFDRAVELVKEDEKKANTQLPETVSELKEEDNKSSLVQAFNALKEKLFLIPFVWVTSFPLL